MSAQCRGRECLQMGAEREAPGSGRHLVWITVDLGPLGALWPDPSPLHMMLLLSRKKSANSGVASARGLFFQAQCDLGAATPSVRAPAPAASTPQRQR